MSDNDHGNDLTINLSQRSNDEMNKLERQKSVKLSVDMIMYINIHEKIICKVLFYNLYFSNIFNNEIVPIIISDDEIVNYSFIY